MLTRAHCFTYQAAGRLTVITTDAQVRSSVPPSSMGSEDSRAAFRAKAIWDTGATGTVITQTIVDTCGLKPIGMTMTHTANGQRSSQVFLVDLRLPNAVVASNIRVTVGDLGKGGPDMLIGMDIIGHGDFAVTCHGGKTTFSFRMPSMEKIDFEKAAKKHVGRNDPCPCGAGPKFKNCCGKNR